LYNEALGLWPDTIDISDGRSLEDGILFSRLNRIWYDVENLATPKGEWHQLMTWVIFSTFHSIAKQKFFEGKHVICKKDIVAADVRKILLENLEYNAEYKDMLTVFLKYSDQNHR